jgi:murein DD-endopeptidase MepM/ murein hydrolase activator NlpD
MDSNDVEIVSAAAGTILYKSDGNFDRSCTFNNNNWNAVYVQHSDGSVAWYGHMKAGTLTTKNVGASVAQGEYLGVVGSSGNSTGPHLHFEVYDSGNNLIDPYAGTCNTTPEFQSLFCTGCEE